MNKELLHGGGLRYKLLGNICSDMFVKYFITLISFYKGISHWKKGVSEKILILGPQDSMWAGTTHKP